MPSVPFSQPLPVPVELIHNILWYLSPREIVRLRVVSKQFREITEDPSFGGLYMPMLVFFVRPSEQLSSTWTSEPAKITARVLVVPNPPQWDLLFGRWFVWTDVDMNIRCHDLDTGAEQVLWQHEGDELLHFDAYTTASPTGQLIYIILYDDVPTLRGLLEYRVEEGSGSLSDPVSHDVSASERRLTIIGQAPRYSFSSCTDDLLFDPKTRIFYMLPQIHSELDTVEPFLSRDPTFVQEIFLTKAHIIAFRCWTSHLGEMTLIQAYHISDSTNPFPTDGIIDDLCLTCETSMEQLPWPIFLISSSAVNTITGFTNVKFLVGFDIDDQTHYRCLELMLPEPCSGVVRPMAIHTQDLFTLDSESMPLPFAGGSDDGHVRGLIAILVEDSEQHDIYNIRKFSVDASQETCTVVLGEPSPVTFPHSLDGISDDMSRINCLTSRFDAMRGRLCYDIHNSSSEVTDIAIFDLE
ncbi:hypothetical protein BU15DRAFT_63516 [Melanogaster broomeanus]|nr:hypothetical protein BU15DRAFT_63516 [Melanogaster broomeanus]